MIWRATYALFISLICSIAHGQLGLANELFDNFEYAAAAELYAKAKLTGDLDDAGKEQLAFCYIMMNEHRKAEATLSSISERDVNAEAMHLEALRALGQTDQAREGYAQFCKQYSIAPDQVWLSSLDSIDHWKDHVSSFEVYDLAALNTSAAELSPVLHKDGLLFLSERISVTPNSGGPALAYAHGKPDLNLQYGADVTPRTYIAYSEFAPSDTLSFNTPIELFGYTDQHLGPFCLDKERGLIYFSRSEIPELGHSNSAPWIYFGKYDILPDKVAHVKPFGAKVQLPLFEIISQMDESDIRDERRKILNGEDPDEQLVEQIELYLRVINMKDDQIIEVVDSLFEAGDLSGSLINAINEHIEKQGTNPETRQEKQVFWQPKAGVFAMGTPTLSHDGKTMIFASTDGRWLRRVRSVMRSIKKMEGGPSQKILDQG